MSKPLEFSFVMPCLNEIQTLEICVRKCNASIAEHNLNAEIIVADNGSTDGSVALAESLGCKVVKVERKGYGSALIAGIGSASGTYVIMGDADDSYDFSDVSNFVDGLRAGNDVVIGNRMKGGILPGAMPPLHKYLGNPVLSFLGRLFYNTDIGDFHCGLRGFHRQKILNLGLKCSGMEFASEMLCKAVIQGLSIAEVPIKLYPDGRDRAPHLRSWRDGWRHLRFLLIHSPNWLFIYPGLVLIIFGIIGTGVIWSGPVKLSGLVFDINTMLYTASSIIIGLQMLMLGCFTKLFHSRMYSIQSSLPWLTSITLERGLVLGMLILMFGFIGSINSVLEWQNFEFGDLDPRLVMRQVIPSVMAIIGGGLIVLNSLALGVVESFMDMND